MAIFEQFTTDLTSQILDTKNLIADLKNQLEAANNQLTELEQYEQAQQTAKQATESALTQLEAAIQAVSQVYGQDGLQEIRDRVNGLLDTVGLLEGDTSQETTSEVTNETDQTQAENDQEDENKQDSEQPTITVESIPVDATESDDEQSNPETDEAIDEKELRDGVEDWINTEHHATVRKWAREWFDIDTTDIKIANIRNLIREKTDEFKYDDVAAFWDALNSPKFDETK